MKKSWSDFFSPPQKKNAGNECEEERERRLTLFLLSLNIAGWVGRKSKLPRGEGEGEREAEREGGREREEGESSRNDKRERLQIETREERSGERGEKKRYAMKVVTIST